MNRHVYADQLGESLRKHRDLPALHIKRSGEYQSWTFGELHRDLNRLVSVLKAGGFGRGRNAVVIGENTPEWVMAYHGIILAGGCCVPVDPNLPSDEIREIISIVEATIVFCSPSYLPLIAGIKEESSYLETIVLLDTRPKATCKCFPEYISEGDAGRDAFSETFQPDDPMTILFTSGTTGKAKGAVLTQKNYTAVGLYGVPRMQVSPDDTMLAILPLHHVFGFAACCAAALIAGIDVVFVTQIKGPLILEALNDKKVSILPAEPKMLTVLYDNIDRKVRARGVAVRTIFGGLKLVSRTAGAALGTGFRKKLFHTVHEGFGGRLRVLISGGASLGPKYFRGFRLMGFDIVEGYGLTETFGPITLCPATDPRQGSVGPVFGENEVRIENPDKDGVGEVLLRGLCVFQGYYKNTKATDAVFDSEGWFHTGDLGRLSKGGYLYLVGRSKDVIVLESGKNVYPDELEDYYAASTLIEEIGIFGATVKDREIIAAVIVPSPEVRKKNDSAHAAEIMQNELVRMGHNRPSYKKVTDFVISFQALPRTTTRKLKKHDLRSMFEEARRGGQAAAKPAVKLSAVEETVSRTAEFVEIVRTVKQLAPQLKQMTLTPRSNLELDLELDSLRQIDLFCALEEAFSIPLPEEELTQIATLGDLYAKIMHIKGSATKTDIDRTQNLRQRIAAHAPAEISTADSSGALYQALPGFAFSVSWLLWGVKAEATDAIPTDGPVIFASNHESLLDFAWILGALPWPVRRRTFTIGKVELMRYPLFSSVLKACNMIPVERQGDVVDALKASVAVLKQNRNLVIFPEGTRSRSGSIAPFKSGIGLLMLETNALVVPVRVRGSYGIWPAGKLPKLFVGAKARPTVRFGTPISLQSMAEDGTATPYDTPEAISAQVQKIVEAM